MLGEHLFATYPPFRYTGTGACSKDQSDTIKWDEGSFVYLGELGEFPNVASVVLRYNNDGGHRDEGDDGETPR